jgi:protein TonB
VRRLLLAVALALAFHGLLFTIRFEGRKATLTPPPRQLTLSLAQRPAEPPPSLAVSKIPEPQDQPPSPRLQQSEGMIQRQRPGTPEKPSRKMDSSFLPRKGHQDYSTGSPGFAAEEGPLEEASQESPPPPRASLGGEGQGSAPTAVREAPPLYRRNPAPGYPLICRKRGYQGTVTLEVLVSREGRVEDLRLSTSSGYSVLDQAALTSVKTWLFDPGTRGGEKVDMWVKVPVRFQLE